MANLNHIKQGYFAIIQYMSKNDPIITYYKRKESLWGYATIWKGVKHFGYYPKGKEHISLSEAQENMSTEVGKRLKLPSGSLVLDAGCGEGPVSVVLAKKFGYRVEGIDLLDFNVRAAAKRAENVGVADKTTFSIGDYAKLNYPNNHFDGVVMVETLVHAPDYKTVLKEIKRVLKPGGVLVFAEYTKTPDATLSTEEKHAFDKIITYSSMPAFTHFLHDTFPKKLKNAGFTNTKAENVSERIIPMTKKMYNLAKVPYKIVKLFNLQKNFINSMWGVYHYPFNKNGIWRYNIVRTQKPKR